MSIKSRGILIVVCVLAGSLCLLGAGPNVSALSGPGGGAIESNSVLVEAFVVEVNLPALAQQGVSPIGRQPHAVAVADLLKCLDGGQARVIGGTKISSQDGAKADTQVKRTIYIRREKGTSEVNYEPYDAGESLSVKIERRTETSVCAGFRFSSVRFTQEQKNGDTPPAQENWEWSGSIDLPLGEPRIAGATQNGETAVFLLLVADAQDD